MTPQQRKSLPAMVMRLSWLPVLAYFVTKYLVFGGEMTGRQNLILLACCLVAELAIWLTSRRLRHRQPTPDSHGTDR